MLRSIRFGFATNSSSSHSVVLSGTPWLSDYQDLAEQYTAEGQLQFGWEEDYYDDLDSIINYAFYLYLDRWEYIEKLRFKAAEKPPSNPYDPPHYSSDLWEAAVSNSTLLPATKLVLTKLGPAADGYIDHQSIEDFFPDLGTPEEKFWAFVQTCASIVTGNDNN